MKTLLKLAGASLLSAGIALSGFAGSFSVYAQAAPLPNYFTGQVSVPSAATCMQQAQAFIGSVVNDGPLGSYNAFQGSPAINVHGSINAGTYNYTVEVVPQSMPSSSGYSVLVITW